MTTRPLPSLSSLLLGMVFVFTPLLAPGQTQGLPAAKADYTQADEDLNVAWAQVRKALAPERLEVLKAQQKVWLGYREGQGLIAAGLADGAENAAATAAQSPSYHVRMAAVSRERAQWLRDLAAGREQESLTGVWWDDNNGSIEIVEKDGSLHFHIAVVRGPSFALGHLAGIAKWNRPLAWFSDLGRLSDKKDETNIVFILRDGHLGLEVSTANAGYYLGMRAYFEGTYFRVGDLNNTEQEQLLKKARTGEVLE